MYHVSGWDKVTVGRVSCHEVGCTRPSHCRSIIYSTENCFSYHKQRPAAESHKDGSLAPYINALTL